MARSELTAPTIWQRLVVGLATGGGVGWLPVAPGTAGTALGLPLAWVICHGPLVAQGLIIALLCLVGIPLCGAAARQLRSKDPGNVIWDEIVTVPIVFLGVPVAEMSQPLTLLLGFALHRLFDISKVPPARQLESLPGGWGIMCDDIAAGIYGWAALAIIRQAWLNSF